jgi:hypothetical protein
MGLKFGKSADEKMVVTLYVFEKELFGERH